MPKNELSCPVEITLKVIFGCWKVLIIHQLLKETKRFNQLQRELQGLTHRTLSKQLRKMEAHGLVIRKDYQETPPRVEYSLSALGKSLENILMGTHEWWKKNGSKVSSQSKGI